MKINSLSMVAEDHSESTANARTLYECIRHPLVSDRVSSGRKLPLVYVVDSILKNVKGKFTSIIEEDARTWMPVVHSALSETGQAKLKKVWNLWKNAGVFEESKWKDMGACFSAGDSSAREAGHETSGESVAANSRLRLAGISISVRCITKSFPLASLDPILILLALAVHLAVTNHVAN